MSNDDGYMSSGLRALTEALEPLGVLPHAHRELGLEGTDAPHRQLELLRGVRLCVFGGREPAFEFAQMPLGNRTGI